VQWMGSGLGLRLQKFFFEINVCDLFKSWGYPTVTGHHWHQSKFIFGWGGVEGSKAPSETRRRAAPER